LPILLGRSNGFISYSTGEEREEDKVRAEKKGSSKGRYKGFETVMHIVKASPTMGANLI
jgi:hypothetical protein